MLLLTISAHADYQSDVDALALNAYNALVGAFKNLKFIFALLVPIVAFGAAFKAYAHKARRVEEGQARTQGEIISMASVMAGAFLLAVAVLFLVYGFFAVVFANPDGYDVTYARAWQALVTDYFNGVVDAMRSITN